MVAVMFLPVVPLQIVQMNNAMKYLRIGPFNAPDKCKTEIFKSSTRHANKQPSKKHATTAT
jgi:hypothetical protein